MARGGHVSVVVHVSDCRGCNGTYVCERCKRECGWCFGCADDMFELCDDCWLDVTRQREADPAQAEGKT